MIWSIIVVQRTTFSSIVVPLHSANSAPFEISGLVFSFSIGFRCDLVRAQHQQWLWKCRRNLQIHLLPSASFLVSLSWKTCWCLQEDRLVSSDLWTSIKLLIALSFISIFLCRLNICCPRDLVLLVHWLWVGSDSMQLVQFRLFFSLVRSGIEGSSCWDAKWPMRFHSWHKFLCVQRHMIVVWFEVNRYMTNGTHALGAPVGPVS